jgi:hypothetical protein
MHLALLLGVTAKTLWDPTIIGILAPVSGVFLFCGSAYLLLSTNLGARLGFLIAASALTGFMVLLSTLWLTSETPLESPKGRTAEWKVLEVDNSFSDSKIPAVRTIDQTGSVLPPELATTIRSFLDSAFVRVTPPVGVKAPNQPFANFDQSSKYITDNAGQGLKTYQTGGGTKAIFWHHPQYAAVAFCSALDQPVPFGEPPAKPKCDPAQQKKVAVLVYDYGSIRLPPVCYLFGSIILFILSMLGLHWYEKDERERARQAAAGNLSPVTT